LVILDIIATPHEIPTMSLDLAWKRYAADLKDMAFVRGPFENEVIEHSLPSLADQLKASLDDGSYRPRTSEIVDIPKPGGHIRPGAVLNSLDGIVFHELVTRIAPAVQRQMLWSAGSSRFSYILKEDQTKTSWFVYEMRGWMGFAKRSLELIDEGYRFVLFADISAFFENVSLKRLASDLNGIGIDSDTRNQLSQCLSRWAEPRGRGIPQGYRPSFVLSELYLDSIDRRLHGLGIPFARYVDDCRLFFHTEEEALGGMQELTRLLREKELNLQTKKSYIRSSEDAREEIDGVNPLIREIQADLKSEVAAHLKGESDYINLREIRAFVQENKSALDVIGLERAFDKHVVNAEFNKTLFHFCINRLGAAGSTHAIDFCVQCAIDRPEELIHVLRHIVGFESKRVAALERIAKSIEESLPRSDRSAYEMLRALLEQQISSDRLLQFARTVNRNPGLTPYTKDFSRAYLGSLGDSSDLDAIEASYGLESRDQSRSAILASIRSMVLDRRNALYGNAQSDSELCAQTIAWAKSTTG